MLNDPERSVQDGILFTFDDVFGLSLDTPGGHIRALRTGDWTYAVYFDFVGGPFEYELYDLANDPGQLDNLVFGNPPPDVRAEWNHLHARLTEKMMAADAMPEGVIWPENPAG